jgi:hypothetical protein
MSMTDKPANQAAALVSARFDEMGEDVRRLLDNGAGYFTSSIRTLPILCHGCFLGLLATGTDKAEIEAYQPKDLRDRDGTAPCACGRCGRVLRVVFRNVDLRWCLWSRHEEDWRARAYGEVWDAMRKAHAGEIGSCLVYTSPKKEMIRCGTVIVTKGAARAEFSAAFDDDSSVAAGGDADDIVDDGFQSLMDRIDQVEEELIEKEEHHGEFYYDGEAKHDAAWEALVKPFHLVFRPVDDEKTDELGVYQTRHEADIAIYHAADDAAQAGHLFMYTGADPSHCRPLMHFRLRGGMRGYKIIYPDTPDHDLDEE